VKEAEVIFPFAIVQIWTEIRAAGVDANMHVVSVNANPVPETVTTVPSGPEAGAKVICGPVTTKFAEAISPELPLAETV